MNFPFETRHSIKSPFFQLRRGISLNVLAFSFWIIYCIYHSLSLSQKNYLCKILTKPNHKLKRNDNRSEQRSNRLLVGKKRVALLHNHTVISSILNSLLFVFGCAVCAILSLRLLPVCGTGWTWASLARLFFVLMFLFSFHHLAILVVKLECMRKCCQCVECCRRMCIQFSLVALLVCVCARAGWSACWLFLFI